MQIIDKCAVPVRISGSLEKAVIAGRAALVGAVGIGGQTFIPASGPSAARAAEHGGGAVSENLNRNLPDRPRLFWRTWVPERPRPSVHRLPNRP